MWLKVAIVLLFIGILISLSSGLVFLVKDFNNSRLRTLYSLGTRITLATVMMGLIVYGFYTGQLFSKAPWDNKIHGQHGTPVITEPKHKQH
ncbi:hypothetical protein A9Q90_00225 [Gammaproteobacteria bacterium 54_18_T64]|nr:hypothetical protein A9Q90_00225 [Gammaproteobacteria bacterium 54_18_T64]